VGGGGEGGAGGGGGEIAHTESGNIAKSADGGEKGGRLEWPRINKETDHLGARHGQERPSLNSERERGKNKGSINHEEEHAFPNDKSLLLPKAQRGDGGLPGLKAIKRFENNPSTNGRGANLLKKKQELDGYRWKREWLAVRKPLDIGKTLPEKTQDSSCAKGMEVGKEKS